MKLFDDFVFKVFKINQQHGDTDVNQSINYLKMKKKSKLKKKIFHMDENSLNEHMNNTNDHSFTWKMFVLCLFVFRSKSKFSIFFYSFFYVPLLFSVPYIFNNQYNLKANNTR